MYAEPLNRYASNRPQGSACAASRGPSGAEPVPRPVPWIPIIGLLLLVPEGVCADAPPWATHSILELSPPEPVPLVEESEPADSVRLAFERLAQVDEDPGDPWQPASDRFIAEFGAYRIVDKSAVEERLEIIHVQWLFDKAQTKARQQRSEEAMRDLEEALDHVRYDRSRFLIQQRLGVMAFRNQDYARAEYHMAEALALQPRDPAVASNLAAAQMTRGHFEAALKTLESIPVGLIRRRHLLFSIHFNKACLFSMMERPDEAFEHLVQAAEYDPPATWTSLGDTHLDPIRDDLRFLDLRLTLEHRMTDSEDP